MESFQNGHRLSLHTFKSNMHRRLNKTIRSNLHLCNLKMVAKAAKTNVHFHIIFYKGHTYLHKQIKGRKLPDNA